MSVFFRTLAIAVALAATATPASAGTEPGRMPDWTGCDVCAFERLEVGRVPDWTSCDVCALGASRTPTPVFVLRPR